jgi:hypothetical protein
MEFTEMRITVMTAFIAAAFLGALAQADTTHETQYFYLGQASLTPKNCDPLNDAFFCLKECAPTGNYVVQFDATGTLPDAMFGRSAEIDLCGAKLQFIAINYTMDAILTEGDRSVQFHQVENLGFDNLTYSFLNADGASIQLRLEKYDPRFGISKIVK